MYAFLGEGKGGMESISKRGTHIEEMAGLHLPFLEVHPSAALSLLCTLPKILILTTKLGRSGPGQLSPRRHR